MRFLGLLSGTSADGVDAALLEVRAHGPGDPVCTLLAYHESPLAPELRARVLRAAAGDAGTRDVAILRRDLGPAFASAALEVLALAGADPASITALGCHGQTVWHEPPAPPGSGGGTSLQLLDPALLAAMTGIPVVSDFRSADLAAGGEGAPLVPWADRILFSRDGEARALLNLGGMGNVTWLGPRGDSRPLLAFDTGPGNALMDIAAACASAGRLTRDEDGGLARSGRVDAELLDALLADPFFRRPPPRSTGRERFGPALVAAVARERGLEEGRPEAWCDLMATLAALTVESAARSIREWVIPRGVDRVVVTGGGAHNPVLMEGLRNGLAPIPVETGALALGMDPDAREAAAFALLAWAFVAGVPGNVAECTGASGPRILGSWTPAPGRDPRIPGAGPVGRGAP